MDVKFAEYERILMLYRLSFLIPLYNQLFCICKFMSISQSNAPFIYIICLVLLFLLFFLFSCSSPTKERNISTENQDSFNLKENDLSNKTYSLTNEISITEELRIKRQIKDTYQEKDTLIYNKNRIPLILKMYHYFTGNSLSNLDSIYSGSKNEIGITTDYGDSCEYEYTESVLYDSKNKALCLRKKFQECGRTEFEDYEYKTFNLNNKIKFIYNQILSTHAWYENNLLQVYDFDIVSHVFELDTITNKQFHAGISDFFVENLNDSIIEANSVCVFPIYTKPISKY